MPGAKAREVGDAMRAYVEAAHRDVTVAITARLIELCPVDTGHARANFVPGIGEPPVGEQPSGAQQAGIAAIAKWKLGDGEINITNNVPYIDRLIAGSSQQAPAGWDLRAIDFGVQETQQKYDGLTITASSGVPGLVGPSVTITASE